MRTKELYIEFKKQFDIVGIIKSSSYLKSSEELNVSTEKPPYPIMVVLGLAYPKRIIKSDETHAVASFYTFGRDYHHVLKERIEKVMNKFNLEYVLGVDNHPFSERLAAQIAGIGFLGKNQLIINEELGSYLFLGMVFINTEISEEITHNLNDSCGDCRKCIVACPVKALSDYGYDKFRCISYYNQEKEPLTKEQIIKNYCLFGCDVCQLVCPKNIGKGALIHSEFKYNGKEKIKFADLFSLSNKEFNSKYNDMAYLWKGKTVLMRNGLTLLIKQKNHRYDDLIKTTIGKVKSPWYEELAKEFTKE